MTSLFSIGGLASGLDTQSIVSQLVSLERIPITQTQSRQTALRRVDTAWADIVSKLSAVRTSLDNLDKPADYGTHTSVTSSSTAVTATRTGAPAAGGLSFTVSRLASTYQGALSGATSLTSPTDLVGAGSIQIRHADGSTFTSIDTTGKTLAQVASAITGNAELQANASVQQASDGTMRLLVSSRRSGEAGGLEFDLSGAPASLNSDTELFAARDALLTMGSGAGALEISSPTNRMTNLIDGVTVDLKEVTTTPVTVQVERDTSVTTGKVRELVNAMNSAISTLKARTAYDAASQSSGVLQGERTAVGLRFALSGALTNAVAGLTGTFTTAASIGITVGRDGLVTLDEGKLSTALADDFDGVMSLLTAPRPAALPDPPPDPLPEPAAGPGVFTSLDALLKEYEGSKGRIAGARKGLTDRIDAYDEQIERHEVRIELRERMIRAKFSGLESALSGLQAQGSTLLSALGFAR